MLAVIAENLSVEFSDRVTMTAANLPILLAVMFLGGWPAMIVAACSWSLGMLERAISVFIALFNDRQLPACRIRHCHCLLGVSDSWGFAIDSVSVELLVAGVLAGAAFEATNLGVVGFGISLCTIDHFVSTGKRSCRPSFGHWPS